MEARGTRTGGLVTIIGGGTTRGTMRGSTTMEGITTIRRGGGGVRRITSSVRSIKTDMGTTMGIRGSKRSKIGISGAGRRIIMSMNTRMSRDMGGGITSITIITRMGGIGQEAPRSSGGITISRTEGITTRDPTSLKTSSTGVLKMSRAGNSVM